MCALLGGAFAVAGGGDFRVTCLCPIYLQLFRQVVERKFDYAVHVVIVQTVVNFFAYALVAYQFCLAQYTQLVADGGLGHVEQLRRVRVRIRSSFCRRSCICPLCLCLHCPFSVLQKLQTVE